MSAFMLAKEHIDVLVHLSLHGPTDGVGPWSKMYFGNPSREITAETADRIGEMLVRENLKSINFLYPDTVANPDDVPGPIAQYWHEPYTYTDPKYRASIAEAFSAIACYEYQSCEHDTWKTSQAKQFCEQLQARIASRVPGFDQAPWGWDAETLATKAHDSPFILLSGLVRKKITNVQPVRTVSVSPVTNEDIP